MADQSSPTLARQKLIADLVDVNAQDTSGLTPLHHAVIANDPIVAEQLIRMGADPRVRSRPPWAEDDGMNAFGYAEYARDAFPEHDRTAVIRVLESAPRH